MVTTRKRLTFMILGAFGLGLIVSRWLEWQFAVVAGANAFFALFLIIAATDLDTLDGDEIRHIGRESVIPALSLGIIVLGTAAIAITALFSIINADDRHANGWLIFALLAIPLGWATTHTMMAFHYAHLYWRPNGEGGHLGGLEFPGNEDPDGWDFMYVAFGLGTATQTGDVAITNRTIRRIALGHSIVAYGFNTVLVATAVNLAFASS